MDFQNKNILAPMVRVTTLPMRLLALKYGADYVYSEEIVDFKILRSKRIENNVLGTVDYVMDDGTVSFRTCLAERKKLVFQMGTADPQRALKAAKMIENDVSAIDINMGCPKEYSTKGGMGAALLRKPDLACDILRTLVQNLSIPVTCKIRILKDDDETLKLVKQLASTGISAISVHGRYREERPRHPVHDNIIKLISSQVNNVAIIANGGSGDFIKTFDDIGYFKQCCGVTSAMIGRAAMWNPTVFSCSNDDQQATPDDLIKEYLEIALKYDNHLASTKYCITQLLHDITEAPGFRETIEAATMFDISKVWSLSEYCLSEQVRRDTLTINDDPNPKKKIKLDNCADHVHGKCRFLRRFLDKSGWSPKLGLIQYCVKMKWEPPKYTLEEDHERRLFFCSIVLNNKVYTNEIGDKNKRFTEHAISCICLNDLGLITDDLTERGLVIEVGL